MIIKKFLYVALFCCVFSFVPSKAYLFKQGVRGSSESLYAQVLNLSMQTWSDSRLLSEYTNLEEDFFDFHDLIVGRLLRLQRCVYRLCQSSLEEVLAADIAYIVTILTSMEDEQRYLYEKNIFFKDSLVLELLKSVKQQLTGLF
ncbi:MAG: hypothetical protein M1114_06720 [Candidatus Dependentiae bacterium]|nr:hypothetical protein [Candidatus Dependentiae bacterium]